MKIILLSFYDLGKQPKIISELVQKIDTSNNIIEIIDYSIEDKNVITEEYDVLGINASMHTASVLAEEFLNGKVLPKKLFVFGLYAHVFADMFPQFVSIDNFLNNDIEEYLGIKQNIIQFYTREAGVRKLEQEISKICRKVVKSLLTNKKLKSISVTSKNLQEYLGVKQNVNYSFKNTVPDRSKLPHISEYSHIIDGENNIIAGSTETTYGCKHECTHCPVPIQFHGSFKTFGEEKIMQDVSNQVEDGAKHTLRSRLL